MYIEAPVTPKYYWVIVVLQYVEKLGPIILVELSFTERPTQLIIRDVCLGKY